MHPAVKKTIKNALLSLGVDARWHVPRPPHQPATLLDLYGVDAIFDIGANTGVSGEYFRNVGFKGKIVSFEPVGRFYERLAQKCRHDSLWLCERAALGDARGELQINVSGGSGGASSFLSMTDNVREHAPDERVIDRERVTVETVDSMAEKYYPEGDRLFLKIDTQGYEKRILDGAKATLGRVVGMKAEMSVVENFEGEVLIYDMLPYLYSLGFRLTGIEPGWSNAATQEVYQVDGFLFRTERLPDPA